MRYAIVIEKAEGNFSAYVPDLPGCVATAPTVKDVERETSEADPLSYRGLRSALAKIFVHNCIIRLDLLPTGLLVAIAN